MALSIHDVVDKMDARYDRAKAIDPRTIKAFQEDAYLKILYKRRMDCLSAAVPIVVQLSSTEFKAAYSDNFNEVMATIQKEINLRQEQIMTARSAASID